MKDQPGRGFETVTAEVAPEVTQEVTPEVRLLLPLRGS